MEERLKKRWILAHLIFLAAFPSLATDMYLPSLPTMADHLAAPVSLVNLTLVFFFMFFGGSMIIWGTLSDKYGRKPTLLAGIGTFVATSILCSIAISIYQLILFRVLQATFSLGQRYNEPDDILTFVGGIGFSPVKSLNIGGRIWYDAKEKDIQEVAVNMKYKRKCWGLHMEFIKSLDDVTVLVMFSLEGIYEGF